MSEKEFELFRIKHNNIPPQKGRVLLSAPLLRDPYFKKTVVLITEHNEDGTLGFILNRPHKYKLHELLDGIPDSDFSVTYGGPVAGDTLHCIHSMGELIPGSNYIDNDLYWGGDFEYIKSMLISEQITPDQIRFFLGYSGWSPVQLEDEIQENTWIVSKKLPNQLIRRNDEALWEDSLDSLGGKYKYWARFPDDPLLN